MSPAWTQRNLLVLGLALLTGLSAATTTNKPATSLRLQRTWMPDAYPSSFAVGFPTGLNFCFDPVRANLIYAWTGDFLDLNPTVNGKIPRDAVVLGEVFHRNLAGSGFRAGDQDQAAEPQMRFLGHRIRQGVPEFEYEVDGQRVRESIRPAPDGRGLIRHFRVSTLTRPATYRTKTPALLSIESGSAEWVGETVRIPAHSSVVFNLAVPQP